MRKIVSIIILFSVGWSIGFQAYNISTDASELLLSKSGIALDENISINPASILSTKNRYISFSQTSWYGDVSGQQVQLLWDINSPKLFNLEKFGVNDIELRDDIPQDEPLGQFGTHWVSTGFTTGYQFYGLDFGVSLLGSYYRLYHYSELALSANFGMKQKFNNHLSFGLVVDNLGFSYSDSLNNSLPISVGAGVSIKEPFASSTIFADVKFSDEHGLVEYLGIIVPVNSLKIVSAVEYSAKLEHLAISSGFSFSYRKWGVKYGVKLHNSKTLGMPHSIDIIWYY